MSRLKVSKSFVAVDAKRLADACDAQIESNLARIAGQREKMIESAMAVERRRGWPFFRETYHYSREQAIASLKERELCAWSPWQEVEMLGRDWDERVKRLRDLADQSADGTVYVTEDMAWLLRKYGKHVEAA